MFVRVVSLRLSVSMSPMNSIWFRERASKMTFIVDDDFIYGIHREAFGSEPDSIFWKEWDLADESARNSWLDWAIDVIAQKRING